MRMILRMKSGVVLNESVDKSLKAEHPGSAAEAETTIIFHHYLHGMMGMTSVAEKSIT